MGCPCKDCNNRKWDCHSECSQYKDFKDKLDTRNTIIKEKKLAESDFIDYKRRLGRKHK